MKKFFKHKKISLILSSSILVSGVVASAAVSCAAPITQTTFSSQIPDSSNFQSYKTIYDLEYSLVFYNVDRTQSFNPRGSAVYGTGWLFDFQEKEDSTIFYLGTNLHVADSLRNTEENSNIAYPHTEKFYMGKSFNQDFYQTTYTEIPTLPKTQFVATNFLSVLPNMNYYVDFAVISVEINTSNEIYSQLQNSMNTLKSLVLGKQKTEYVNTIFPTINYSTLEGEKAYIGGYPYYSNARTNLSMLGFTGGAQWTMNTPYNITDYTLAQKFDSNQTAAGLSYGFPVDRYGFYNPEVFNNEWTVKYHDVTYIQTGMGYVIQNSNLAGGSSGSLIMNQNKQIKGIYFGTFSTNSVESPFGLGQVLRFNNAGINNAAFQSYDLLVGGASNQTKSYKNSLNGTSTWMFN